MNREVDGARRAASGKTAWTQAYLDDRLSGHERAQFERRLAQDPELRIELDSHAEIAASVQRSMAVPDLRSLIRSVESMAARMQDSAPNAGWMHWGMAAAAVLLMGLAMFASSLVGVEQERDEVQIACPWSSSLADAVALGVVGAVAVASSARVARGRRHRVGGAMKFVRLAPDRTGTRLLTGWLEGRMVTDVPVVSGMVQEQEGRSPAIPHGESVGPLRYFRRELVQEVGCRDSRAGHGQMLSAVRQYSLAG